MTAPSTLADVRPGDLFFTNIGGIVPGIFPVKVGQLMLGEHARIGRRSFDHVGIVTAAGSFQLRNGGAVGPTAVQAMPKGAEEISLTEARHWTDNVTFMRLPEDYPGQAEDAAAIARAMIGTPYSFLSYAALAAWRWGLSTPRLEAWIGRRRPESVKISSGCSSCSGTGYSGDQAVPGGKCWDCRGEGATPVTIYPPAEAICSVLVDQAWSLTGKKILTGVPHQCCTPGALAGRLLWMPGVEKFGKGIL